MKDHVNLNSVVLDNAAALRIRIKSCGVYYFPLMIDLERGELITQKNICKN